MAGSNIFPAIIYLSEPSWYARHAKIELWRQKTNYYLAVLEPKQSTGTKKGMNAAKKKPTAQVTMNTTLKEIL